MKVSIRHFRAAVADVICKINEHTDAVPEGASEYCDDAVNAKIVAEMKEYHVNPGKLDAARTPRSLDETIKVGAPTCGCLRK